MMLPAKRSGTVYGARIIRSPPIRSSGMPSRHAVCPETRYRTSTVALRFASPVMSHSKPRQISVAGSITKGPGVTPLAARAGDVTNASASRTRMLFMKTDRGPETVAQQRYATADTSRASAGRSPSAVYIAMKSRAVLEPTIGPAVAQLADRAACVEVRCLAKICHDLDHACEKVRVRKGGWSCPTDP